MGSLLGTVIAAIVNALLGRFFPAHPKVTPEVIAQAQKDRADVLQSQKSAAREADQLRSGVGAAVTGKPVDSPDGVFKHDANERGPEPYDPRN